MGDEIRQAGLRRAQYRVGMENSLGASRTSAMFRVPEQMMKEKAAIGEVFNSEARRSNILRLAEP